MQIPRFGQTPYSAVKSPSTGASLTFKGSGTAEAEDLKLCYPGYFEQHPDTLASAKATLALAGIEYPEKPAVVSVGSAGVSEEELGLRYPGFFSEYPYDIAVARATVAFNS